MVPRRMAPRRTLGLVATAGLVLALSACSPLSLFANWGGSPAPSRSATQAPEAETPNPTPSRTPSATPTPGCIDRVISAAGTYRVDNCENLTVAGSGITVTAQHLGTLTIVGDSLQVYAQTIGALDVKGDLNTVQTNDEIGTILVTGSRNMITVHAGVTSVVVNGDDNTIAADGGVDGEVENNGQRNTIGAQP